MGTTGIDDIRDLERGIQDSEKPKEITEDSSTTTSSAGEVETTQLTGFSAFNQKLEALAGLEARGIERVPESERQAFSTAAYIQMALIWFSANITANNLALGLFGPLVFDLSFTNSALCSVFGGFVGCPGTSYMGTWGAISGNRTLVCYLLSSVSRITANEKYKDRGALWDILPVKFVVS
jgi:hypothetical protein